MLHHFRHIKYWLILTGLIFVLSSCITKEFNFGENKMGPDWNMQILFPLFYGDLEFNDFIYNWRYPLVIEPSETTVQLKYSDNSTLAFPLNEIFESAVVIDSFNFLVEGDNYINEAALNYIVTNGSPYPMYLQLRFFEKTSSADLSPAIISPPFPAATLENGVLKPEKYELQLPLTSEQLESLILSNRVQFVSWFADVPGFSSDTLSAHYPIQLSIILSGIAHGKKQ